MNNVDRLALFAAASLLSHPALAANPLKDLKSGDQSVSIVNGKEALNISVRCPRFTFEEGPVEGTPPGGVIEVPGESGSYKIIVYPEIQLPGGGKFNVELHLKWNDEKQILHKWAKYQFLSPDRSPLLKEVVLDEINASTALHKWPFQPADPQTHPFFMRGFFAGVEFPVSSMRQEADKILISHRPGIKVVSGAWRETKKAVYGAARPGYEIEAFERYIADNRPKSKLLHVNYNSWWTSPVPFSESDILKIVKDIDRNLYKTSGVSLDSFTLDLGWSDPKSIWKIDSKLFPNGFSKLAGALAGMKCSLGIWSSPSSCYSPAALDNVWAGENGFELFKDPNGRDYLCLAGPNYSHAYAKQLADLTADWKIRHFKLDGYIPYCYKQANSSDWSLDELTAEGVAEGAIRAFQAIHNQAPDAWLEATCFGWNPSPWWLFYVNSVIGSYGDDSPAGRSPCPVYRESVTTARDYFNLQGSYWLPIPDAAQEVLGIIHQTPEPFMNDAVTVIMRGHGFLPLYINPAYMSAKRWQDLAKVIAWARANASFLADTKPILPISWQPNGPPRFHGNQPMPREPYGYAHINEKGGLIHLRNPWVSPFETIVALDESTGLKRTSQKFDMVGVYPERRLYAKAVGYGSKSNIWLAPYETVVIRLQPASAEASKQRVFAPASKTVKVRGIKTSIYRFNPEDAGKERFGPDWTRLSPVSGYQFTATAEIGVNEGNCDLLVLLENSKPISDVSAKAAINGKPVSTQIVNSDNGWQSTGQKTPENWVFIRIPLVKGRNKISATVNFPDAEKLSAWIWSHKPSTAVTAKGELPPPETVSTGGQQLMASKNPASTISTVSLNPEIETIEGVYLDWLTPESVTQGWGTLQKNRSVWEKPITIAGRSYLRGLGTHAPSRIVYALDGTFTKFKALAGGDGATNPSISFEVLTDGVSRWKSPLMGPKTPPANVDIDITGVKKLELVVSDGGNGMMSDHANWANARILK